MATILAKIADIEAEMSRTQKNKATEGHLGLLKAKLAKLRREITDGPKKSGGGEDGFDVKAAGDARVGLIGFPSVGKSTLLSKLTGTYSEAADYEFTTLTCIPAVYNYKGTKVQLLDLPGIIEGASEGKGLGLRFLRHIERNSILLFLVPSDSDDIKKEYDILENEIRKYNPELLDKERILAISKTDMLDDELIQEIKETLPEGIPSLFISSVAQQGLTELKDILWEKINYDPFKEA